MGCHGLNAVSGLLIPDLRGSAYLWDAEGWSSIVLGGERAVNGMPKFIDKDDAWAQSIRAYVIQQAWRGKDVQGERMTGAE